MISAAFAARLILVVSAWFAIADVMNISLDLIFPDLSEFWRIGWVMFVGTLCTSILYDLAFNEGSGG